jgi:hypothetical protein
MPWVSYVTIQPNESIAADPYSYWPVVIVAVFLCIGLMWLKYSNWRHKL